MDPPHRARPHPYHMADHVAPGGTIIYRPLGLSRQHLATIASLSKASYSNKGWGADSPRVRSPSRDDAVSRDGTSCSSSRTESFTRAFKTSAEGADGPACDEAESSVVMFRKDTKINCLPSTRDRAAISEECTTAHAPLTSIYYCEPNPAPYRDRVYTGTEIPAKEQAPSTVNLV